jgi:hypothetical protein
MQTICPDSGHNRIADCNHDDYFNTNPPVNSYLATHWNAANNEFLIGVSAQFGGSTYSVSEGASGVTLSVVLSEAPGQTVTVSYEAGNGTAHKGSDYLPTKGTLTFLPDETSQSFTVPIKDDPVYEGDETFIVTLSAPVNAWLGPLNPATVAIADDDPLPSPTLISPADNAPLAQYTPAFDWNDTVPAPDHYQVQIAADSAFANVTVEQNVTPSNFTPATPLNPNTLYYWRVRVFNAQGQSSSWSAVRKFRTAPAPPVLSRPIGLHQPASLRPLFDWESAGGGSSYILQISTDPNFTALVLNLNISASAYTPTTDLPRAATLFWRVRVNNVNGLSAWSRVRHFDTPNPPSIPTLLSPANNAATPGQPTLDWSDSTPGLDHYEVQISTSETFATVLGRGRGGRTSASMYTPEVALPSDVYYWRVRAVNTAGQFSNWSSARSFRVP